MPVTIGLKDIHYALVTTDPDETGKTVYGTPKKIAGAMTANINPNTNKGTLFADDGPMESAAALGEIELEMMVADIPSSVQADILGHKVINGIVVKNAGDVAPYVAVGFKTLRTNGKYKYVWLLKGKFMEPADENETKGDTINFKTPTLVGSFVKRESDDNWEFVADEDDVAFTGAATWFTSVPDAPVQTP